MDAHTIRSEADRRLAAELLGDDSVQHIQRKLAEAGTPSTRRNLLARALRLTPEIAPREYGLVQRCVQALGVEAQVELYVYPLADYNAGCTPVEDGRVFILVSSALLEGFTDDELLYVLGHELGHHIYEHHDIPLPMLLANRQHLPPRLVLKAHSWQRFAEISADRAGLLCSGGDLNGAASALFKLSSGLKTAPGPALIEAFIAQAVELYRVAETSDSTTETTDWLSTHPFSPIRLRALQAFADFDGFEGGDSSLPSIELVVEDLLTLMEPNYLHEDSPRAEAMRRLLFAAGVLVAAAHEGISRPEREALGSLLGEANIPRSLSPEALREVLPERIQAVREACRWGRRAQLVRDLVLIAKADDHVHPTEVQEMVLLARALGVDEELVHCALASCEELD